MAIAPRGMTITEAYRSYRARLFIVNRTYQRKLVWTQNEKVRLIDSLLNQYPIPLIMLAQLPTGQYEIIDGMQRLNAIFSFIENEYPIDGKYFDVNEFATAKQNAVDGIFTPTDSEQLLTRRQCADILEYQLAVTIFSLEDESDVTDVFGRINSGGKQLSPHEQRQAGIVLPFANFVRYLSSELRGDVSDQILDLSQMPAISVEAPSEKLGYGIRAEDTFWCKQGVLRPKELRDSYDEQVVADLAISILLNQPFAVSRERLDDAYDSESDLSQEINDKLIAYQEEKLADEIKTVMSVISDVIEGVDPSPNVFRSIVHPTAMGNAVRTPFYAVFMAFYRLIVIEHKKPVDSPSILQAISNLASKLETDRHHVRSEDRVKNVDVTYGLIQRFFVNSEPPLLGHGPGLRFELENSLRRSKVETPRYEFKQGFINLDSDRSDNWNLINHICEIVCSIANIGPQSEGSLFIGVADKKDDADRINMLDGVTPIKVGDTFVVGIDRECKLLGIKVEDYFTKIVSKIRSSNLSDPLKTDLLSNIDCVDYRDFTVIRLFIPHQTEMSWIGGKSFIREGSLTREADGRQIAAITKRFSTK